MAEEFQFPKINLPRPSSKAAMADPVKAKIIAELERYVEGELMSDTQKREVIAAVLSGMMFALDLVIPKKKEGVILPVFARRKVIELAKTLGMNFIGEDDPTTPAPPKPEPKAP